MKRKFKDYFIISLKGLAIGAADLIPGVSGGTIAFISGIYEELLDSISNLRLSVLFNLKKEGFKSTWKALNVNFLLAVITGVLISIFSLTRVISFVLNKEPVLVWSFFFGLVLASILFIGKEIKRWNFTIVITILMAFFFFFIITILTPLSNNTPSYSFLFFSASLAICATILPGISGAFVLILLGVYEPILNALNTKNFKIIITVGLGAILGLLIFSRLLKWFFNHHRDTTLAVLLGFIIGSLNKIWPWKQDIIRELNLNGIKISLTQKNILPFDNGLHFHFFYALFLAIAGFLLILTLEKLAKYKS